MAEWRTRGYVADSDDEDESQDFLPPVIKAAEAPSVSDDVTHDTAAFERRSNFAGGNLEKVVEREGGKKHNGAKTRSENKFTTIPGTAERKAFKGGWLDPSEDGRQRGEKIQPQDDGDIDELQEDHYQHTPAGQLEAELLGGVRDLASSAPSRESSLSERSQSRSPSSLSSLPLPNEPLGRSSSASKIQSSSSTSNIIEDLGRRLTGLVSDPRQPTQITGDANSPKATRSLRHRNPIQLHPYAIESEQYRQVLKARGVKPLRIAQMEAEAASAREEESQNADYVEESQDPGHSIWPQNLRSSSPLDTDNLHAEPISHREDTNNLEDDELPDVNTLFSNSAHGSVRNCYKRRKIASASFRMPSGINREIRKSLPRHSSSQPRENDGNGYDVPLSPPHSGSQTPVKAISTRLPRFQAAPKASKTAIPTPVTSSEPRRPQVLDISEGDLSDSPSHNEAETVASSDEAESDQTSSSSKASKQLQQVQRKIRGVLPASWLKIDLKTQKKPIRDVDRSKYSPSPERLLTHRGVARPVSGKSKKNPDLPIDHDAPFPISDSEDPLEYNHSSSERPARPTVSFVDDDRGILGDRFGEAAENDQIDAMLPSATRRRHHTRGKKKRQTKIVDPGLDSQSKNRNQDSIRSDHPGPRRTVDGFDKGHRRKSRLRPPKLSILDTSHLNSPRRNAAPSFLKIAYRAARSRKDQGRHSPSQKYLRLASKLDNDDTNETLRSWREDTIIPATDLRINRQSGRQPLHPRSANNAKQPYSGGRKSQSSLDHLFNRHLKEPIAPKKTSSRQEITKQPQKNGQLASSVRESDGSRQAMLETPRGNADEPFARADFQGGLARINRYEDESGISNVLRLLDRNRVKYPDGNLLREDGQSSVSRPDKGIIASRKPIVHRNRKRQPQRVDISGLWPTSTSTPVNTDNVPERNLSVHTSHLQRGRIVVGLGPFGTRYSHDFGIVPLPTGTCFHESTLIGSGAFARSQRFHSRSNLDNSRGYALLHINGRRHRWGPWNDNVSSELCEAITWISQFNQDQPTETDPDHNPISFDDQINAFKAIITYFSDHLSFLDPVDRLSCVQRCKALIAMLLPELETATNTSRTNRSLPQENPFLALLQLRTIVLIFTNQVRQISQHELVEMHSRNELQSMVQVIAQKTLSIAITNGIREFETCLAQCKQADAAAYIFRDKQASVQAFVVAQHVMAQYPTHAKNFWRGVLETDLTANVSNEGFDVRLYEGSWRTLFTLLPFLEFDSHGVLETGCRFRVPSDNWHLVKQLIDPVLEASLTNPRGQLPSFNAYCRALFRRCLHLINGWGWRRCEPIIGTLFDFFARNHLANLRNEESHGSPLFLENLAENPSMVAEPEDRCFHILLKIIGSGIRHMRHMYPEKKIRDIVWRLMPNHGRLHPKEEAVHQADLDALRNHHDLLCTLYWASPSSCRPRLTVIRNLVNLETSHREACHINIGAWSNLVKFQLSIDGSPTSLAAFAIWHDDLLDQILRQHGLARAEAEEQVRSIQHAGGLIVSKELLESTIAKNQRQVEAILSDALVSLKLAVDAARTEQEAAVLVTRMLTKTFDLFDARRLQSTKPVVHTLDVLSTLASKSQLCQQTRCYEANDDSQDYGDWPSFDENEDSAASVVEPPLQKFQEPLKHLLSNAFGSDIIPDDVLLLKILDVWVVIAQVLVRSGIRSWNDYIDPFGSDSWNSLRDTEQTRKYTVLYFATLIEKDRAIVDDHAHFFLKSWLGSLVERESLLKFQHRLTEALLNVNCDSPVLHNLPFWAKSNNLRFEVSAGDFSERRISLISSVLSNMRVSLEEAVFPLSMNATQLRQEYKDMLKHLMGTMKCNYQALGHGSNVRGAYVDFVHTVVELLQQHTSSICPVDRFFTDNTAFPLPATDPTYVVGQLRNYALRLSEQRTPKQLAVFLQSVSERAAIDGEQPYLVSQLHAAMSNTFEDGISPRPTLRSFLVKAIVPTYIEIACTTLGSSCGWILAMPYLQALQKVFNELLLDMDGANPRSVEAVASTVAAFLDSVRQSFGHFLSAYNWLKEASIIKLIAACYSAIMTLLPTLDYIARLSGSVKRAIKDVAFFNSFASYISTQLQGNGDDPDLEREDVEDAEYADVRHFTMQQLKESLMKNWSYVDHEQQYYFTRGTSYREVVVGIGLYEEEKAQLLEVLNDFSSSVGAMPALSDDDGDVQLWREKNRLLAPDHLIF